MAGKAREGCGERCCCTAVYRSSSRHRRQQAHFQSLWLPVVHVITQHPAAYCVCHYLVALHSQLECSLFASSIESECGRTMGPMAWQTGMTWHDMAWPMFDASIPPALPLPWQLVELNERLELGDHAEVIDVGGSIAVNTATLALSFQKTADYVSRPLRCGGQVEWLVEWMCTGGQQDINRSSGCRGTRAAAVVAPAARSSTSGGSGGTSGSSNQRSPRRPVFVLLLLLPGRWPGRGDADVALHTARHGQRAEQAG